MKTFLLASACALVAGCANGLGSDCSIEPYSLGQRDGRLGATPQFERYTRKCGGALDPVAYNAGWHAGYSERPTPLW